MMVRSGAASTRRHKSRKRPCKPRFAFGLAAALILLPCAQAQDGTRYRSGSEPVLFAVPVSLRCSDGSQLPFSRYFLALHVTDEHSFRALTFGPLAKGWRVRDGKVVQEPGSPATPNVKPGLGPVYGSLMVVGFDDTGGSPRFFPPIAEMPADKWQRPAIGGESNLTYRFDCSGQNISVPGPDLFATVQLDGIPQQSGWQEKLIADFKAKFSSTGAPFAPLAVDGAGRPLSRPLPPVDRVFVGRLITDYWSTIQPNNFQNLTMRIAISVLQNPQLRWQSPDPRAQGQQATQRSRDEQQGQRSRPDERSLGTPYAPPQNRVSLFVDFHHDDWRNLQAEQDNLKEYLSSPNCKDEPATRVGGRYSLPACEPVAGKVWVRLPGFEPQLVTVQKTPNGSSSVTLQPLRFETTKALPTPGSGYDFERAAVISGDSFAAAVERIIALRSALVPEGCEPQVTVTATKILQQNLTITKGPCQRIAIPVPQAFAPRFPHYPRIASGCHGQTGPVAASGGSLTCMIKERTDPTLQIEWAPGLKPFSVRAARLPGEDEIPGLLVPQLPRGGEARTVQPTGGAAPAYAPVKLRGLTDDNASCELPAEQRGALAGGALPSVAAMGCRGLPRVFQLELAIARPDPSSVPPADAFNPNYVVQWDVATNQWMQPPPRVDELKRELPVKFTGDMNNPDFKRRVGTIAFAAEGDCSAGQLETFTPASAAAGPQPPAQGPLRPRKWPAKAVLQTSDFRALTLCTEGKVEREGNTAVLQFKFKSLIEPGKRIVVVWTPSDRLNQNRRFERIKEWMKGFIATAAQEFQRSESRYRFDVLHGGPNGNLDRLFSGEYIAAQPAEALVRLDQVPYQGPPAPNLSQLEGRLEYPLSEIAAFILIMDGDPQAMQQVDRNSAIGTLSQIRASAAQQPAGGAQAALHIFTRQSCQTWAALLVLPQGGCSNLEDQGGMDQLLRTLESIKQFRGSAG